MLFNEPKLLKWLEEEKGEYVNHNVSVLFNEPKLLKSTDLQPRQASPAGFSALQRAEIAEITIRFRQYRHRNFVSVLFNEPKLLK